VIINFKIYQQSSYSTLKRVFEQLEYNEGDYVLLDLKKLHDDYEFDFLDYDNEFIQNDPMFKIIDINLNDQFPYGGEFYNGDYMNLEKKHILRKLTPEEIENFEINRKSDLYNL
jgi:hypothetical protein